MYRCCGKRLLDLVFSFFGLIAMTPVFLIVSIMIKCNSRGPVFFRQRRIGRDGKMFFLFKFRSMIVDKAREKEEFKPGSILHVTKVGRMLRKTKLDEIPQLINVFMGDMSFVGPRPEVAAYKDFYAGEYSDVLGVRPGITDRASIKYLDEERILSRCDDPKKTYREIILPDKLKLALTYVRDGIGLREDIGIIFQTLLTVLKRLA